MEVTVLTQIFNIIITCTKIIKYECIQNDQFQQYYSYFVTTDDLLNNMTFNLFLIKYLFQFFTLR